MYWDQGQVLMKYMGGFIGGILGTIFLLCPCVVFAAAWNDPNVVLIQSTSDHAYRDAKTGQYVSTKGMPTQQPTNPSQNASSTQSWTSTTTTGATPEWTYSTASTVTSMTGTTSAGSTTNQKLPYQNPTPTTTPKAPYETPTATVKPATPKAPYETPTVTVKPATTGGTGTAGAATSAKKVAYETPTVTVKPATTGGTTGTTGTTATTGGTGTAGAATSAKKVAAGKVAKGAGAALGAAAGAYGVYESTKGNTEHSVGNVLGGAASGALAGASVGSVVPGIGTAVGAGIGAVVGGLISGSQLFSETDCLTDPVTDDFTCCHTVFNKGERQANIGDYMFCGDEQGRHILGAVRQCITPDISKTKKKVSWGLDNDAWSPECELRWCSGETPPASGQDEYIKPDPDMINFCWRWGCIDGFVRSGDLCVSDIDGTLPVDQYETVINKINALRQQIISTCGAI